MLPEIFTFIDVSLYLLLLPIYGLLRTYTLRPSVSTYTPLCPSLSFRFPFFGVRTHLYRRVLTGLGHFGVPDPSRLRFPSLSVPAVLRHRPYFPHTGEPALRGLCLSSNARTGSEGSLLIHPEYDLYLTVKSVTSKIWPS